MPQTYKSSREIFAKFANLINPQNAEWRADAPEWINTALTRIGNGANLKSRVLKTNVKNYRFKIPTAIKLVRKIYLNDVEVPLYRLGKTLWYRTDATQPNYIETSFEKGEIKIVVATLNTDKDNYPMIPNDLTGDIDKYLFFYILRNWLIQGNTHHIFKYEAIDIKIDGPVGRLDLGLEFAARNAMKRLTPEEMGLLRDSTVNLYDDYQKYDSPDFKEEFPNDPNYNYN